MLPIKNYSETTLNRRSVPLKDMKWSTPTTQILMLEGEYQAGVYCKCGASIIFRNHREAEPVSVKCPICGSIIYYG